MKVHRDINVRALCHRFEVVEDVLEEYGVHFRDEDYELTLGKLCAVYSLSAGEVIRDITNTLAEEPVE